MTQPPIAVPVCYRHPSRETYVRCTRCDRPICPDCMREASVGHQCPDCVAAGRRDQRPARTTFGGGLAGSRGYVTIGLIVVNCLVALAAALSAHSAGALFGQGMAGLLGGSTPLHTDGSLVPVLVADGQYYRLLTSMFLHYGIVHLGMNMWALWVLGRLLESVLGPARFFLLYMIAGLGGSVAVYAFADPRVATVGASGAIFGLFSALFVVLRRLGRNASSILPVLLLNLVITFTVPGISIQGHLGGLVTGAVVAAGIAYAPTRWRTQVQTSVAVGVGVALVLATVARTAMIAGGIA
jgi:membrane associated rhomboid family serine protease